VVLLAKKELGGAAGLVWEKVGAEGAIEVHPRLAHELLSIPGELFFVVEKEVKKIEEEVKVAVEKAVSKKAAPKPPVVEEKPGDDLSEALEVTSTTKRRSKE